MGWWKMTPKGRSFARSSDLRWGDEPADAIDSALDAICDAFESEFGRPPTKAELKAGFEFSVGDWDRHVVDAADAVVDEVHGTAEQAEKERYS